MKITVLGCGATYGVPVSGNDWGDCDPNQPKNIRLRPSVCVEYKSAKIIIDIGPDFREQTNRYGLHDLDAIIITHCHGDHIFGIFELPRYMMSLTKDLNIYCNQETLDGIKKTFYYLFENEKNVTYFGDARIIWNVFKSDEPFIVNDIKVIPMRQFHGYMTTIGLKINGFCYNTDFKSMPEESYELIKDADLWIADCDNPEPSYNHANTEEISPLANRLKPKMTYLTHMDEDMDYDTLCAQLPSHIRPAYDGLEIILKD